MMEKSRGSLFPDTLHIVDIIIGLCNGISSSFSNMDSRLIYLAYRADLFFTCPVFSGSLCSSVVLHRFSLYPNPILSHSWINLLLFRMEICSPESRLGCYFSLIYNNLYDQHSLFLVYSRYISRLQMDAYKYQILCTCFSYIYFGILTPLK